MYTQSKVELKMKPLFSFSDFKIAQIIINGHTKNDRLKKDAGVSNCKMVFQFGKHMYFFAFNHHSLETNSYPERSKLSHFEVFS